MHLDQAGIDHQRNLITLVQSKFGESRQLAVVTWTITALHPPLGHQIGMFR
jgi:hypothetical protein